MKVNWSQRAPALHLTGLTVLCPHLPPKYMLEFSLNKRHFSIVRFSSEDQCMLLNKDDNKGLFAFAKQLLW